MEELDINIVGDLDGGRVVGRSDVRVEGVRRCVYCGEGKEKPLTCGVEAWMSKEWVYCSTGCFNKARRLHKRGYLGYWLFVMDIETVEFWEYLSKYSYYPITKVRHVSISGIDLKDSDGEGSEEVARRFMCAIFDILPSMEYGGVYFDYRLLLSGSDHIFWPIEMVGASGSSNEFRGLLGYYDIDVKAFIVRYKNGVRDGDEASMRLRKVLLDYANGNDDIPKVYGVKLDSSALKRLLSKKWTMSAKVALAVSEYLGSAYDILVDYRMLLDPITSISKIDQIRVEKKVGRWDRASDTTDEG